MKTEDTNDWGIGIKTVEDATAREWEKRQKIPVLGNGNKDSRRCHC